jgi:hypothetical protein
MKNKKINEYFEHGFVVIGPQPTDVPKVRAHLIRRGLEFVECEGTYKNVGQIPSFFITGANGCDLKEEGIRILQDYNQSTFLWQPPHHLDKKAYLIDCYGKVEESFNTYTIGDEKPILYTRLPCGQYISFANDGGISV